LVRVYKNEQFWTYIFGNYNIDLEYHST
jgi:hypothetical protein